MKNCVAFEITPQNAIELCDNMVTQIFNTEHQFMFTLKGLNFIQNLKNHPQFFCFFAIRCIEQCTQDIRSTFFLELLSRLQPIILNTNPIMTEIKEVFFSFVH